MKLSLVLLEKNDSLNLTILAGASILGYINELRQSTILSTPAQKKAYDEWYSKDCEVQMQEPLCWRGLEYKIDSTITLVNAKNDAIYDFRYACPCNFCDDKNIDCYANKTPRIY